jgi:DNA modification methylase
MSEVIELNNHRLLNGDATSKEDVAKLIGDCKINLLLTDPPYGIDIVNIGGGKSADKVAQPLDHSENKERERERAHGNNWRSQATNLQESEQWEHQQDQGSKEPQKRGGQIAYGKVGKPRHCSAKTLQTSNWR